MADRFMQHDAGPARREHHVHFAGRRRHRLKIDQRLAKRVIGGLLPSRRGEEAPKSFPPAITLAAGFLAIALAYHDRNVDPHQRPDVAKTLAVRTQDLDRLPARAE